MKKTLKTIFAFVLLAPAVAAMAATPTNKERRLTNLSALRVVQDYGSYATLMNDSQEENFIYVFKDEDEQLYNDLPGLSARDTLSLEDYVRIAKGARGTRVILRNITTGDITDGGNVWIVNVDFDKSVEYNTPCGAIISSSAYYDGKDYHYTATVEVDKDTYETHISKLKGSIDSDRERLAPGFALVDKADPRDADVTNFGKKLTFNSFGQAFIPQPYNLEFADDDVNMKVLETGDESCRQISFQYRPTRWRVKPHVDISFGGYDVDASQGIESSASGMGFGVDLGYVIPSRSNFKIGLYTGVGMSTGKVDLSADEISYNYQAGADADMDADTYIRHYKLVDINQSIKLNHITIPLYADLEYRFSRRFSAFAQVGIKAYLNAGSKTDKFSAGVYSYGIYPQYDNLMMDDAWLNDFGNSEVGTDNIVADDPVKGFSADLLLGLGARVKIVGPLRLELGLSFQNPIIDRLDLDDKNVLPSGSISVSEAPVTYTVVGGQVVDKTLANYCKIKSNPLKVKIGLVFAF